jgi:hypothetical protein
MSEIPDLDPNKIAVALIQSLIKDTSKLLTSSARDFFKRLSDGGLNWSTQHFILEGKDGVWDGTEIS